MPTAGLLVLAIEGLRWEQVAMNIRTLMVVLALVAAGLVGLRACGVDATESIVTPELAGVWTTGAPGHADRFLEIRPREVAFGQGDEGEVRYPLLGVTRTARRGGEVVYFLRYRFDAVSEAESTMEVVLGPSGLYIASQPSLRWRKAR